MRRDPYDPIRRESDPFREERAERSSAVGPHIREFGRGAIGGPHESFGRSSYVVFEACDPAQVDEEPLLFIWLHGMNDGTIIGTEYLRRIQFRLQRRTFFLVPTSPAPAFRWNKV